MANCQRYFTVLGGAEYSPIGVGISRLTTQAYTNISFPVAMRTAPTLGSFSNLIITDRTVYDLAVTAFVAVFPSIQGAQVAVTNNATATVGKPAFLNVASASTGFLQFTAEL